MYYVFIEVCKLDAGNKMHCCRLGNYVIFH